MNKTLFKGCLEYLRLRERAISPGHILTGALSNESVRVDTIRAAGPGIWEVSRVGVESDRFRREP